MAEPRKLVVELTHMERDLLLEDPPRVLPNVRAALLAARSKPEEGSYADGEETAGSASA